MLARPEAFATAVAARFWFMSYKRQGILRCGSVPFRLREPVGDQHVPDIRASYLTTHPLSPVSSVLTSPI